MWVGLSPAPSQKSSTGFKPSGLSQSHLRKFQNYRETYLDIKKLAKHEICDTTTIEHLS